MALGRCLHAVLELIFPVGACIALLACMGNILLGDVIYSLSTLLNSVSLHLEYLSGARGKAYMQEEQLRK